MQKKLFCIIILFVFTIQNLSAQQVDKVIISGYGGQHDLDVKNAFLIGYASHNNTPFSGEVILYTNTLQSSFNYAVANNFDLIIRSTTGLSTGLRLAPDYPTVDLVMPAGSNTYTQVFFGDVVTSPVVITGAGNDSNQTGYKLEFYAIDPITASNLSSYSNGYVAGQIAFIANTLNVSFDSARTLSRIKGSEQGTLDFHNGFGEIKPENIITNPLPVELSSFTAKIIGKSVLLNWQTSTEINNYGFDVERKIGNPDNSSNKWEKIEFIVGNGNSNSIKNYSFLDQSFGDADVIYYRLKQIDNDGQSEYSNVIEVNMSLNSFELYQNYPNPFNPNTTISWVSPVDANVSIKIFDVLGNEITELLNEFKVAGRHEVQFVSNNNSHHLTSGVYFYKIEIKNNDLAHTMIKKMTLLK